MNTLTAPQVKIKLQQNPNIQLVMTLGPKAFEKCHIPRSINIWDIETAKQQFSKTTEIIVYCSDHNCLASYQAYHELEKAGYQNIWRFSGGLREWNEFGYPLIQSIN